MNIASNRRPRRVCATATYLNAGLWGSRFVGDCELATNGEKVWLTGRRLPVWMMVARTASYLAFLPVGFFTGVILNETIRGHWGYPPYYYLSSALLTLLLVVLGLWGAGIWTNELSSWEAVVWPVGRTAAGARGRAASRRGFWTFMNRFVTIKGTIQIEVPIGPNGKPRRLVLQSRDVDAATLMSVLSGVYYSQVSHGSFEPSDKNDPWDWTRN